VSRKPRIVLLVTALLLLLVVIGAGLRLVRLDDKEFWHDESFTALVLSGKTTAELKNELFSKPCQMADLTKYRVISQTTSSASILRTLGEDEPGHAPLFYFMEWIFCSVVGTNPFTMRLLCAILSVLTLPVTYWLAWETYRSRVVAALTTALASLSPLLIYYAQEARDYSIGMLFMTLASSLLLSALRTTRREIWICYALCLAAGLYSWFFIAIVMVGHALYILLTQEKRKSVWIPFSSAVAAACLTFIPWLAFLSHHTADFKKAYDWMATSIPKSELVSIWLAIPYKAFALFGFKTAKLSAPLLLTTILQIFALVLAAVPFKNLKYIHLSIIAVWMGIFAGQDLLTEGARSAVFRYQTVLIVSALFLFPSLIEFLWNRNKIFKSLAVLVIAFIFGIEMLSDSYLLNCKIWPDKAIAMRFTLPIAERLNREPTAFLIAEESSINPTELIDLSFQTHPDCQIVFRSLDNPQPIPESANILYLWNASEQLQAELKSHFDIIDNIDKFPYLKRATRKG
jgi:Dolichyl-phosphate-mannose-protein mannosyltransferase